MLGIFTYICIFLFINMLYLNEKGDDKMKDGWKERLDRRMTQIDEEYVKKQEKQGNVQNDLDRLNDKLEAIVVYLLNKDDD